MRVARFKGCRRGRREVALARGRRDAANTKSKIPFYFWTRFHVSFPHTVRFGGGCRRSMPEHRREQD